MAAKPASRLQVLQTSKDDPTCQTFVMQEDHTLGNSLRYIVMKNPDVQLCSYSVPHPLENKIHFRIQTYGVPAQDVLRQGLVELQQVCQHVLTTFEDKVAAFKGDQAGTKMEVD